MEMFLQSQPPLSFSLSPPHCSSPPISSGAAAAGLTSDTTELGFPAGRDRRKGVEHRSNTDPRLHHLLRPNTNPRRCEISLLFLFLILMPRLQSFIPSTLPWSLPRPSYPLSKADPRSHCLRTSANGSASERKRKRRSE
ncbi:unnamed protein product [Camellia sinensis]